MNKDQLAQILDKHIKWLNDEDDGERADLRGVDLRDANLRDTNLRGADMRGANLRDADMRSINLRNANLRGADMRGANLRDANLRDANLRDTDLHWADLHGANLHSAGLCNADMRGADLREADLHRADLRGANLRYTIGISDIPITCPDTGAFVGWKKCRVHDRANEPLIVKLLITEDAKRSSATGRKCRASKAIVLDVQDANGNSVDKPAYSSYYGAAVLEYRKGKTVEPQQPFDEDRWNECAPGIHFFITRQEAVDYQC